MKLRVAHNNWVLSYPYHSIFIYICVYFMLYIYIYIYVLLFKLFIRHKNWFWDFILTLAFRFAVRHCSVHFSFLHGQQTLNPSQRQFDCPWHDLYKFHLSRHNHVGQPHEFIALLLTHSSKQMLRICPV